MSFQSITFYQGGRSMYKVYSTTKNRQLIGRALTIEEAEHICQNRRTNTKSLIYKDETFHSVEIARPDQRR